MATQADVRRIALAQPGAEPAPTGFAFSVTNNGKAKGFGGLALHGAAGRKGREQEIGGNSQALEEAFIVVR